ncbi:hypothetical protein ACFW9N_17480 [Streptomyces sp. NPDC059496]|uniref:hypothetical protein n=1 Tax=Streptomyces sp. NPDC059496 TaxID=3346851 RepID=UPI0036929288
MSSLRRSKVSPLVKLAARVAVTVAAVALVAASASEPTLDQSDRIHAAAETAVSTNDLTWGG